MIGVKYGLRGMTYPIADGPLRFLYQSTIHDIFDLDKFGDTCFVMALLFPCKQVNPNDLRNVYLQVFLSVVGVKYGLREMTYLIADGPLRFLSQSFHSCR